MKKLLLVFLVTFSGTLVFGQQKATLSDAKISFVFVSKDVKGTIAGFSSSSTIDMNDLSNAKFEGSVKAGTIESGNFLRNWSLKGGKYFDVDTYPELNFESSSVEENENGFTVNGALTIKGTSKPVSINFKKNGDRLVGTTTLFSSDFGINIMKKSREANEVTVTLSFKVD